VLAALPRAAAATPTGASVAARTATGSRPTPACSRNGPPAAALAWKTTARRAAFQRVTPATGSSRWATSASLHLIALKRADGKSSGTTRSAPPGDGKPGARPRCDPVDGRTLVIALARRRARLRGRRDREGEVAQAHEERFGGRGPAGVLGVALLDGDNVVCIPAAKKGPSLALKKETGDVVWQSTDSQDAA
jgi:hypothetical protein